MRKLKEICPSEIKKIAQGYANPKSDCDAKVLALENNASISTIRRVLELAVIHAHVSLEESQAMEAKACFNVQRSHEGKGTDRILVHYLNLREERRKYLDSIAKTFIIRFAESGRNLEDFCENEVIAKDAMQEILREHLTDKDIPDEIFWKVLWKFSKGKLPERTRTFWERILSEREAKSRVE